MQVANCPICYEDLSEASVCSLLCGDVFHQACIDQDMQHRGLMDILSGRCPCCRRTGEDVRLLGGEVASAADAGAGAIIAMVGAPGYIGVSGPPVVPAPAAPS